MSQRNKHSTQNVVVPETRMTTRRDQQKIRKLPSPTICMHNKPKERFTDRSDQSNQYLLKGVSLNKQQNISSGNSSPVPNVVQYSASDDSALVEVTVKTSNAHKQRSKSTVVSERVPWGQMLKKNKTVPKESVFSNFDPLRTLHFLAKELQIHIEALLPNELNVLEIVKAIQSALKRVPPEVASLVHLQQSIGLLPRLRQSVSHQSVTHEISEKPYLFTEHKSVQTVDQHDASENETKMRKLMQESTLKLEQSCKELEMLCTELRTEKNYLEELLHSERVKADFLKKRIEDLENLNKDLSHTVYQKDEELTQLKSKVETLESKLEETHATRTEIKSIVGDLKKSKSNLEQECVKLKHQLRLCAIEKEKYLAVLSVRDRQIDEIRNEMSQLQEVVNDQLVELHNNALASMPGSASMAALIAQQNRENMENDGISTIYIDDDDTSDVNDKLLHDSLNELTLGDEEAQPPAQNIYKEDNIKHFIPKDFKMVTDSAVFESQTTAKIREMFGEIKKKAFALTSSNTNGQ